MANSLSQKSATTIQSWILHFSIILYFSIEKYEILEILLCQLPQQEPMMLDLNPCFPPLSPSLPHLLCLWSRLPHFRLRSQCLS